MKIHGQESCSPISTSWYFLWRCPWFKSPPPPTIELSTKKKKHLELDNMFLAHNSSTTFCFLANSNIFIFKTSCPFEGTHKIVIILRKI